jgi:hypothetical protein
MATRKVTHSAWIEEAKQRFGSDPKAWRFVCPSCAHVASVQDWMDAGAEQGAVAFSCIGRYLGKGTVAVDTTQADFKRGGGPCNYTGGGLIGLNPVSVDFEDGSQPRPTFEFADAHAEHAL